MITQMWAVSRKGRVLILISMLVTVSILACSSKEKQDGKNKAKFFDLLNNVEFHEKVYANSFSNNYRTITVKKNGTSYIYELSTIKLFNVYDSSNFELLIGIYICDKDASYILLGF